MRLNLYDQNANIVLINGIPVSGFADGDYMDFAPDGNEATRTHGGDGPSMNLSAKQGGSFTLGLLATSPAIGAIYALREAQNTFPAYFSVQVVTGVQEIISLSGCMFGKLPGFKNGGPQQSSRQFLIEYLKDELDTSATSPILGGMTL
jgi:hypothetical protein